MSPEQRRLFTQCTGRITPPTAPVREAWLVCGRRSGKSRIASLVATYLAATSDTARLAPGEVGTILLCAVDRTQAKILFGYISALFAQTPLLSTLVANQTADALELTNRTRIEVRASNFRSVRGVTLIACVIDELAFLRDESSAVPDVELVRAVTPSLAASGGLLLGLSSPWAKRGVLWSKYKRFYGQDDPCALVWQAPSAQMNPLLDAEMIATAREEDGEAAASEWDATFRSDLESYVSTELVEAVTDPGITERPPTGVSYCGFLDAASGTGRDSMVGAVAHAEADPHGGAPLVVLDAVLELRPPFDALAACS